MTLDAPLNSARRRSCGNVDNANVLPTIPQGEQKQKKRTIDVLPKPDKLIRYRQEEGALNQLGEPSSPPKPGAAESRRSAIERKAHG
jgi:hypothetical protein